MDFLPFGPIVWQRRGNSGGGGDRGIRRLSFDGGLAASASYVDVRRVWRKEKGSDKGELWSSCGFQPHCEPEFEKSNLEIANLLFIFSFCKQELTFKSSLGIISFHPNTKVQLKFYCSDIFSHTLYWNSHFLLKHTILFLIIYYLVTLQLNPQWKYQLLL